MFMFPTFVSRKQLSLLTAVGFAGLLCGAPAAFAQTAPSLGAAQSFAVLGGSAVTNTGPSVVNGDLGISPNNALSITGFPPGTITGTTHAADGVALQAQNDLTTAYNALAGQPFNADLTGQNLGGLTLTRGVYRFSSSAQLTGTLTLNGLGNPNAVFIFQIGSTLTTASSSSVVLINGAQACNVFWQIGSSATLGTGTSLTGNVLALTSITLTTGASTFGRVLARNGAVTLDTNTINATVCSGVGGGGACTPASSAPTITTIPSQVIPTLPAGGSVAVGFTIGGAVITDALIVKATSSDATLVPQSGMVITKGTGGARVLTIQGADGRSGVATITVTVTDPTASNCATSTSFQLTIGAAAVPTLPEWALIALTVLLALAGFVAMRRRTI
jgi:hypothetical protein